MTNFEFYKDELLAINKDGSEVALVKGKPVKCDSIVCCQCDFKSFRCGVDLIEWLYAEHVEMPKINKKTKEFFDIIETGWVARDGSDSLYIYMADHKPEKGCSVWTTSSNTVMMSLNNNILPFLTLDFVKWEDDEPWSVEDIRNLEVV